MAIPEWGPDTFGLVDLGINTVLLHAFMFGGAHFLPSIRGNFLKKDLNILLVLNNHLRGLW